MEPEKQSATEREFNKYIFQKIKELGYDDGFSYYQKFIEKEKSKREGNYPTYYQIGDEVHCTF